MRSVYFVTLTYCYNLYLIHLAKQQNHDRKCFSLRMGFFRHQTTKLFKTSRLTWQTHDLEIKYSYMTSFKYIVMTFFMCNESIEMGHHSSSIVVCFFFQELHTHMQQVHTTYISECWWRSCGQLATDGEANGSLDLARGSNRCFMQKWSKKEEKD